MKRSELAHILRAASDAVSDPHILVIGSQAILATFSEDELPEAATRSIEADIAFLEDPEEHKSDQVDGAIGEDSRFHESFGVYGQGVGLSTATLPHGWQERLVRFDHPEAEPSEALCLETHDLVISKLVAGREKDYEFAQAMVDAELVDLETLGLRAEALPVIPAIRRRVLDRLERLRSRKERRS